MHIDERRVWDSGGKNMKVPDNSVATWIKYLFQLNNQVGESFVNTCVVTLCVP